MSFRHFLFIPFVMCSLVAVAFLFSFHAGIRITRWTTSIETHLNRSKSYRRIYQIETLELHKRFFFFFFIPPASGRFVCGFFNFYFSFPGRASNAIELRRVCVCPSVWCCSGMCRSFLQSHESRLFGKPRCCKNFYYYDYFYDFLLLLLEFCVRACVCILYFWGTRGKPEKGWLYL